MGRSLSSLQAYLQCVWGLEKSEERTDFSFRRLVTRLAVWQERKLFFKAAITDFLATWGQQEQVVKRVRKQCSDAEEEF